MSGERVTITLHSDGMGDHATEADFAAWYRFVAARIDARTGFDVTLEMARFGDSGSDVPCWTDESVSSPCHDALFALWEEFCADDTAWPSHQAVAS